MEHSLEKSLGTLRGEINRKVGRCILKLQQYEMAMKWMLRHQEFRNNVDDYQEKRKARFGSKTLGQLVGELTGSFLNTTDSTQDKQRMISPAWIPPSYTYWCVLGWK